MTGYDEVGYYRTAAGAVTSATTMTTDPEWVASLTDDVVVNIDDLEDMTAPVGGRHPHNHQHQQQHQLISVEFVSQVVAFVVLDLIVVVGNVMVIAAVFTHSKLRCTTTNKFVVSLAVADLMVGIVVLPFSSANQVLRYWPFGTIWCRAWLAIDVWLCTASIFNLCAISLDRYLAISRPIKYPTVMSPMRARLLIITVWILSFVICFPPLIGWNGNGSDGGGNLSSPIAAGDDVFIAEIQRAVEGSDDDASCCFNESLLTFYDDLYTVGYSHLGSSTDQHNSQAILRLAEDEGPQCALTLEPGYIVYSACGSFWVPMLGMVVFYGKIYKTAVAATEAMKRGFVEKKTGKTGSGHGGGGGLSNSTSENTLCTLRIHRGGSTNSSMIRHSAGCISELFPRPGVDLQRTGSTSGRRSVDSRLMSMKAAGEVTGGDVVHAKAAAVAATADVRQPRNSHRPNVIAQPLPTIVITSSLSCAEDVASERKKSSETTADSQQATDSTNPGMVENSVQNGVQSDSDRKRLIQNNCKSDKNEKPDTSTTATDDRATDAAEVDKMTATLKRNNSRKRASSFLGLFESENGNVQNQVNSVDPTKRSSIQIMAARFAKLHIISQLRSLNKEKRAAKTVGIIVGCFVVCWAPFFTVYLAEAFCRQCTPTVVFHVFFWLGYCNSAANPFIYGLCSRDFRYAFQKFLRCECVVGRLRSPREGLVRQTNGQVMGMLQMMTLQIVARGAASSAAANV